MLSFKKSSPSLLLAFAFASLAAAAQAPAPPATPQFEVASVKPAANDGVSDRLAKVTREFGRSNRRPGEIPMMDPGYLRLKNWALLDLIAAAYSAAPPRSPAPTGCPIRSSISKPSCPKALARKT